MLAHRTMKQKIHLAIGALLVLLVGTWIYWAQLGVRSTTFAGPDFDARNTDESSAVYSEFSHHLEQIGFRVSSSPSEFDSWAGMHSAGSKRIWYVKSVGNNQKTSVSVDLDKTALRTDVKWEVFGTHRKAQLAKKEAYRLALELDDWITARKELNEVPQRFRDQKRQSFSENLAKNQES